MSFLNYINEFFLFRWLFGNRNKNHSADSTYNTYTTDYSYRHYYADDNFSTTNPHQSFRSSYRGADIYDDEDDEDDALDDFDPTDSDDCRFNDFTKTYDYHNHGYSRSYDDFHEEQDDYDMMDDDF